VRDFALQMAGITQFFILIQIYCKVLECNQLILLAGTHMVVLCCSIGNFFFAGARIFFQSLDAAIFLYSRVSHIPTESLVLPAICTNDRLTLGCELHVCMEPCSLCPPIVLQVEAFNLS
jgi:hypothetical protein